MARSLLNGDRGGTLYVVVFFCMGGLGGEGCFGEGRFGLYRFEPDTNPTPIEEDEEDCPPVTLRGLTTVPGAFPIVWVDPNDACVLPLLPLLRRLP